MADNDDMFKYTISQKLTRLAIGCVVSVLSKLCWRFKLVGLDNLPQDRNFLLCSNHVSYFDPLWIHCDLPKKIHRKIVAPASAAYFVNPIMRHLFRSNGNVPIRSVANKDSLNKIINVVNQGCSLILFPEGTRSHDGQLGKFKAGAAYIAISTNIPIVPIYIQGAYEIYSRHHRLPRFLHRKHQLTLYFGKPLYPNGYTDKSQLTQGLKDSIKVLMKEHAKEGYV